MKQMQALLLLVGVLGFAPDAGKQKGLETASWSLEIRRVDTPWTYVEEGGRGEDLDLTLTASPSTSDQPRWANPKSIRVTVHIGSEKLPDHEFSQSLEPSGIREN